MDDPHPELRCRCVASADDLEKLDPYLYRCPSRATAEDGLCDVCREPPPWHPAGILLEDPLTPCLAAEPVVDSER